MYKRTLACPKTPIPLFLEMNVTYLCVETHSSSDKYGVIDYIMMRKCRSFRATRSSLQQNHGGGVQETVWWQSLT